MRILKRNRIIATIGIALMILLITAGCGSNKNSDNESGVTDEAAIVLSNEKSTANTEDVASEGTLETTNISEKYIDIADYNSYDELIEDIKNLLDVMEELDEDTFFDRAEQYEWFTFRMSYDLENDSFGYLQADIDGDGVDELLLGTAGSKDNSNDVYIDNMYTIRDGKVVPVFESLSERESYVLYEDGVFVKYINYPDDYYSTEYFKYTAGKQEFIEGIYDNITIFDWEKGEYQEDIYYSDSSSKERELTIKERFEMGEELQHKYNLPKFQLHLFKEKQ
ncbi:MAG: FG-GAP repeat protein [Butyrivibrio sp.]|nr:FG-GAP repeat protein [Butyrivibrio sp.]